MFHNTTTIWHNPYPQQSPFKEKRQVYGILGTLKAAGASAVSGVLKAGYYTKRAALSWPVRATAYPITWTLKKSWQGAKWTYKKATWGGYYGKELGLGVVGKENSFGRSLFELVMAPVNFVKYNLIDNTRDIIKGIFTTPLNILRFPKNLWLGFKEGISNTRKQVSDTFINAKNNSPLKALNSTRKAVQGLIGTPFRTLWKPTRAVLETPINVTRNEVNAVLSYPRSIPASFKHLRGTISRILGAHNTASGSMAEREEREKIALKALSPAPA